MEARGKSRRERTPERERVRGSVQIQMQDSTRTTRLIKPPPPPPPIFKKVQVVYYLSKNGLLEQPHFMEVTHLAHHHLRLKDVMDRLTILRGRGMPSLYSWSYKRSYRNGYVWNDLAENDDIQSPSEGVEYILKGSELIDNTCTEKYHHPQVLLPDPSSSSYNPKRKNVPPKRHCVPEEFHNTVTNRYEDDDEEYYDEKTTYTAPNTPYSRCSIGVSTDEIELQLQQQKNTAHKNLTTELTQHNSSPPSTTSSSMSDKNVNENSKRFEDGDSVGTESILSRNSVLYNLIACGGSVSFRGKNKVPVVKGEEEVVVGRKSSSLHKGVLCKSAATVAGEDEDEIRCMSENPRFGNLQAEEKEYFSGSIVEAISEEERVKGGPCLKKSTSYNEERSWKAGLENVVGEEREGKESREKEKEKEKEKDSGKGKCLPRSRKSSTSCFSNFI